MASTSVLRPVGQTVCLSVTATAHAPVALANATNDQVNFASCINTGLVAVAIRFTPQTATAPASTPILPVDGTPGDYVLPPAMEFPIIMSIPAGAIQVAAIGAGAGPSLIYITPTGDQS